MDRHENRNNNNASIARSARKTVMAKKGKINYCRSANLTPTTHSSITQRTPLSDVTSKSHNEAYQNIRYQHISSNHTQPTASINPMQRKRKPSTIDALGINLMKRFSSVRHDFRVPTEVASSSSTPLSQNVTNYASQTENDSDDEDIQGLKIKFYTSIKNACIFISI